MTVEDTTADDVTDDVTDDVDVTEDDAADEDMTVKRSYISQLRTEAKDHRHRAETAEQNLDATLRQLFTAQVTATGKLADPEDLDYDAELLADADKLTAAVDELITRKPHLAARKVMGSVGQGVTGKREEKFSLLGRLQQSV
ncbi:hypothetical protein [Mycobacterium sp. 236(2023)]|uniref:hypothetical protein n=1 Tax=Mycobacterium sp. 236(2023) TaxID=3038163 RepID=UPI0024156BB4|nr:hypothetical protein [Mycobacterium sp. 236(2023)]MDG4669001.1 hypothetical protein [Mycobacterium sp. 236(2023)]